jgi:hypothetical protein
MIVLESATSLLGCGCHKIMGVERMWGADPSVHRLRKSGRTTKRRIRRTVEVVNVPFSGLPTDNGPPPGSSASAASCSIQIGFEASRHRLHAIGNLRYRPARVGSQK